MIASTLLYDRYTTQGCEFCYRQGPKLISITRNKEALVMQVDERRQKVLIDLKDEGISHISIPTTFKLDENSCFGNVNGLIRDIFFGINTRASFWDPEKLGVYPCIKALVSLKVSKLFLDRFQHYSSFFRSESGRIDRKIALSKVLYRRKTIQSYIMWMHFKRRYATEYWRR